MNPRRCQNILYSGNNVTIGEFKTLEECMNYPLKDVWNEYENSLGKKDRNAIKRIIN